MGAVLADASLQRRAKYQTVVLPRVRDLVKHWPDASTTSGFVSRMEDEDVALVLRWKSDGRKMRTLRDLTRFLSDEGVETTGELRVNLLDRGFRTRLRGVYGVGPKTVDYLSILTGSPDHVAVDTHLRAFARDSGVERLTYAGVRDAVVGAAGARGWTVGALDAAIWTHQRADTRPRQS